MDSSFTACLAFTRAEEGGYVADRRDSGNWTGGRVGCGTLVGSNMGVGAPALVAWMGTSALVTAEQMRQLSVATFEAIARSNYWTPLGCSILPAGLDLMAFDFGWNRGPKTSLDLLRNYMEIDPKRPGDCMASWSIQQSGRSLIERLLCRISTVNIRVLQQALKIDADGIAGPKTITQLQVQRDLWIPAMILALGEAQENSYQKLANFPVYGAGWLARSSRRQAAALAIANASWPQKLSAA